MTAIGKRPEPSAVRINHVAPDRRRLIGPISDYTVAALGVTNEKDPPIRTLMPISVEVGESSRSPAIARCISVSSGARELALITFICRPAVPVRTGQRVRLLQALPNELSGRG